MFLNNLGIKYSTFQGGIFCYLIVMSTFVLLCWIGVKACVRYFVVHLRVYIRV